ncbi:hypothetical protein BKA65DRAFT_545838 [Rhexocercosporidium sp. MPI-PUGE-AT-0058]|nr:hypothetical protein BKA65DRAFT_545838 [Rhexocercosporidium sp. MPI-PUGE-AT-0058]
MKFSTLVTNLALLVATVVLLNIEIVAAAPAPSGSHRASHIPEHYEIVPLLVTGSINGIAINHTGTIEEVFAQLDAEENSFKLSDLTAWDNPDLQTRDTAYMTDVNCIPVNGQNWNRAKAGAINTGIQYLRRGYMSCWVNAHSCARVSCSWDSGIYFCNNNNYNLGHPCAQIADYAAAIYDRCKYQKNLISDKEVGGQAWDDGNWNVPVHKDRC